MSHMVEIKADGSASLAYTGETPWHGLGKKVLPDLTPDQMLVEAGLDWEVDKKDVFFEVNGKKVLVKNKKALVRSSDGRCLDVIGTDWNPLQNADAFAFFNDFVQAGDMMMDTAGSLDDGRRVWALAKVNDAFEVFKDDVVEQYLLFSNPHKYGLSIDVRMTPIRVVCNNTLTFALNINSERMVRVGHRTEFNADVVKETLGVAAEKLEMYKEAARFLGSKRFTESNVVEYFSRVFPKAGKDNVIAQLKDGMEQATKEYVLSRNASQALTLMDTQPGAQYGEGTWWQAFNTVTFMTDHVLGRSADTRLKSAWFGGNRNKKNSALELALEYAEAA